MIARTVLALALLTTGAAAAENDSLSQVVGRLAAARSLGEDTVHLVKQSSGSITPAVQIGVMQRYSAARAAFNGYIAGLQAEPDLDSAARSAADQGELDQAAKAEAEFVSFVETEVVKPKAGNKGVAGDLLGGVASLVDSFANFGQFGIALHKEWTRASDARRQQIERQLADLQWQQYWKIP